MRLLLAESPADLSFINPTLCHLTSAQPTATKTDSHMTTDDSRPNGQMFSDPQTRCDNSTAVQLGTLSRSRLGMKLMSVGRLVRVGIQLAELMVQIALQHCNTDSTSTRSLRGSTWIGGKYIKLWFSSLSNVSPLILPGTSHVTLLAPTVVNCTPTPRSRCSLSSSGCFTIRRPAKPLYSSVATGLVTNGQRIKNKYQPTCDQT